MAYAKFLSVQDVFDLTPIDKNVDPDLINKFIDEAQEFNIQSVIGTSLYTKLMNDIDAQTISGYYYTLVSEHIMKCQAYWVLYQALPFIAYQITNKGLVSKHSEYSDSVIESRNGATVLKELRKEVESKAQYFMQRIVAYLEQNLIHFPELYGNVLIGNILPKSDNYFGGLYLPSNKKHY